MAGQVSCWERIFALYVKPNITYKTAKKIKIFDWRLGLTYYFLVAGVGAYTLWAVLQAAEYLDATVPTAEITAWALPDSPVDSTNTSYADNQNAFYSNFSQVGFTNTYKFCNNPNYDFEDPTGFKYMGMTCAFEPFSQVYLKDGEDLFFTSQAFIEDRFFYNVQNGSGCNREGFAARPELPNCSDEFKEPTEVAGRCYCRTSANRFYVGVEDTVVEIMHAFDSKYQEGKLPKTYVRRDGEDKNYETFDAGRHILLPLWRLLEIAGVSLDDRNDGVPEGTGLLANGETGTVAPYLRVTGVKLYMKFVYYNFKDNEDDQFDPDVYAQLRVKASKVWASLGSDVSQTRASSSIVQLADDINADMGLMSNTVRYGVRLSLNSMGVVYSFSITVLISALVQGLVMVSLCETAVEYIATYNPFSLKTPTYKEAITSSFDIFREAARFAVRALVAGEVYDIFDKNSDATVTPAEMQSKVERVFLDEDKLKSMTAKDKETMTILTQFIFSEMDVERKEKKGKANDSNIKLGQSTMASTGYADGKITKCEWVDLVSAGETNMTTLMQLIENMSDEKKQRFQEQYRQVVASHSGINLPVPSSSDAPATAL